MEQGFSLGLGQRIADIRQDNILGHARPHTGETDRVVGWIRIRRAVGPRGAGFMYLTETCLILHWILGKNETEVVRLDDIKTWGVNKSASIGPIIGIETSNGGYFLQIATMTHLTARHASVFLETFAMQVPNGDAELSEVHDLGTFETPTEFDVFKRRKSIAGMTRRILVTVLGILMIAFAILIIPVPGPWSLLMNIAGLALLSSEYDWAQDVLGWVKQKYAAAKKRISGRKDT